MGAVGLLFLAVSVSASPMPRYAEKLLTPSGRDMKGFQTWLQQRKAELNAGATVIQTRMGPMEYKKEGRGPTVICLHGGFGGYDQAFLMGQFLVRSGFTVIGFSRSGYLRTPLRVGQSLEEQADSAIALMDALGIKQAAMYGFSAGTPIAFLAGVRHPKRVSSVVLTGLGTPADDAIYYQFITLFLQANVGLDVLPYGLALLIKYDLPAAAELMFAVDSELTGNAARRRMNYVLGNPEQRKFLIDMANSLTPLSVRRLGTLNDVAGVDAPWDDFAKAGLLKKNRIPTLIVDAINDGNGSYPQTVKIANKLATSTLLPVKKSGHFIWLGEDTVLWQAKMVTFLKNNRP